MKWTFAKLARQRFIFPAALSGHCNAPRAPARCGMELQCALDKQVHWWCDSPPKSRDIVKDLRRNILLRHQKVDWSEDLTTEFILLRGSRLQILLPFSFWVSLGEKKTYSQTYIFVGLFSKMRRRTAGPRGFSSRLVRVLNSIVSALHTTNTLDTWTRTN